MQAKSNIVKATKILVSITIAIIIIIFAFGLTGVIIVEIDSRKDLKSLYSIPEEKVTIGYPLKNYTDISTIETKEDFLFSATKLSKEIQGTAPFHLYTIENSDDAIGNIYACLDYPDSNSQSKIYVKNAELVPRDVNAESILDVSVSSVNSDYIYLNLSKEQIEYLQCVVFEQQYDLYDFSDMEPSNFSNESYRIHFHIKGITGLYYNSPLQVIQQNNTDSKYYLQNGWGKYMLLPDDLQQILSTKIGKDRGRDNQGTVL